MTDQQQTGTGPRAWEAVEHDAVITAALAEDALRAMEASRSRNMDEHRPAAERIAEVADEFDRPDLRMRAELILADIRARQGSPLQAQEVVRHITARAEENGDSYLLARGNFLLATIQHALGDQPSTRIHGIRGVEALPDDAPRSVMIDHLIMLAIGYRSGPDAERCYQRALDLAAVIGDADKAIGIHNNLAYFAWEAGERDKANEHVARMLELSQLRGLPLKASPLETVARVYIMNGRYDDAVAVLAPVVSRAPDVLGPTVGVLYTEPYALPECLVTLSEAHRHLERFDIAQELLTEAQQLAEDRGLTPSLARALEEQARLYAATGDYRRAYEQHKVFHQAVIAMHSEEEDSRARIVQASYVAAEGRRDVERFRELAIRDPLTGLYNRRFVDDQLATLTTQAAIDGVPLSAAIVDADFFKRINDSLSHAVGDRVLRTMAGILAAHVVAPETVGRIGGEEFVVLMPGLPATAALARCEGVRQAIADFDWTPLTGAIPVTVSIGVTTAPTGQTSPSALLSDADRNLYAAKRSGRNQVMGDSATPNPPQGGPGDDDRRPESASAARDGADARRDAAAGREGTAIRHDHAGSPPRPAAIPPDEAPPA